MTGPVHIHFTAFMVGHHMTLRDTMGMHIHPHIHNGAISSNDDSRH